MGGASMGNVLPPPPDRPGLGATFKRLTTQLIVGDPNNASIFIGSPVPADLVAFYTGSFGATVVINEWEGWFINPTHYFYKVAGRDSSGRDFIATGFNNNGTFHPLDIYLVKTLGGNEEYDFGADVVNLTANTLLTINDATGAPINIGNDADKVALSISGVPHGWGVLAGVRITTIGALTGTFTGETNVANYQCFANVTANRLHRVGVTGLVTSTVATDRYNMLLRRDTALSGTELGANDFAANTVADAEFIWMPTVTETVELFVSFSLNAGTGILTAQGSPGAGIDRAHIYVEDIGPNDNWGTA